MAAPIIMLTGAPDTDAVSGPPGQRQYRDLLLPEYAIEGISFCRAGRTCSLDEQPQWSVIPAQTGQYIDASQPQNGQHIRPAAVNDGEPADFLEPQLLFAEAGESAHTTQEETQVSDVGSDLSSFLDQSIGMHDHSQLLGDSEDGTRVPHPGLQPHIAAMSALQITNLDVIPSASYLHHIEPQTMTVNLIVGIISVPTFRSVFTKMAKQYVTLLEFVVADECKAGFSINIWLGSGQGQDSPLLVAARTLRRGQIVLLRNVALNSFRGRVYGQSIRRNLTKIERPRSQCSGVKIDAVRRWVADFVAPDENEWTDRGGKTITRQLPPDTQ